MGHTPEQPTANAAVCFSEHKSTSHMMRLLHFLLLWSGPSKPSVFHITRLASHILRLHAWAEQEAVDDD